MTPRWLSIILVALSLAACVGDSSQPTDAGNDGTSPADASPDVAQGDASTTCVFGTSHFGDGCKFGP